MNSKTMALDLYTERVLSPTPPFSFNGTVHKPSHFPTPDTFFEPDYYWQSLRFYDQLLGIKLINKGSITKPEILLQIYSSSDLSPSFVEAVAKEIEYRFDMRSDIKPFIEIALKDSVLGPTLERWNGMRASTPYSLYEFTVVATVLQNTTVRRTVQMMDNLFSTFGHEIVFDAKKLSGFWLPNSIHEVAEQSLRDLKLGYRAKTLKRQADFFSSQRMNMEKLRSMDLDELKEKLLEIYGIGPASVQYLLFEVFHHYGAFTHISPWEQKIYSMLLFNEKQVEVSRIVNELEKRFGKWKMLAMHYIFEDLFWLRKNKSIPWLEELIRL